MLGAEFVALDIGIEKLRVFLYKLLIMVVPILLPSLIYGDNMSVIHNTKQPDSILEKKSNSICYHAISESVAMKESMTGHVPPVKNPKEICTKVVPGRAKRKHLIGKVLHDLY